MTTPACRLVFDSAVPLLLFSRQRWREANTTVRVLTGLECAHLPRAVDITVTRTRCAIELEPLRRLSLSYLLDLHPDGLPEGQLVTVLIALVRALKALNGVGLKWIPNARLTGFTGDGRPLALGPFAAVGAGPALPLVPLGIVARLGGSERLARLIMSTPPRFSALEDALFGMAPPQAIDFPGHNNGHCIGADPFMRTNQTQ